MNQKLYLIITIGASLIFLCIALGLFLFGPPQLPIWYSLPLAEQQLDKKIVMVSFPLAAIIFSAVNFSFAKKVKGVDVSLETLFLYASYIPLIILGIACIHILSVVL